MQYGFHFLVLIRRFNFSSSSLSVIQPFFNNLMILALSCPIIVHMASGLTGAPVIRLQINLASGSFLNGCSFNQSLT